MRWKLQVSNKLFSYFQILLFYFILKKIYYFTVTRFRESQDLFYGAPMIELEHAQKIAYLQREIYKKAEETSSSSHPSEKGAAACPSTVWCERCNYNHPLKDRKGNIMPHIDELDKLFESVLPLRFDESASQKNMSECSYEDEDVKENYLPAKPKSRMEELD